MEGLLLELVDLAGGSGDGEEEEFRILLMAAEGTSSKTGGSLLGTRGAESA